MEKEKNREVDITICPNCEKDENTVKFDERLKCELWFCHDCKTYYDVIYDVKVKEIKVIK